MDSPQQEAEKSGGEIRKNETRAIEREFNLSAPRSN